MLKFCLKNLKKKRITQNMINENTNRDFKYKIKNNSFNL